MSGTYGEGDIVTTKDTAQSSSPPAAAADLSRDTWEAMSKHPHRSGNQTDTDHRSGAIASSATDRSLPPADGNGHRSTSDGRR